jgi:uncharacterized protein (DUF362 family)
MEKNQIFIMGGSNYQEMTRELLEKCRLEDLIKDREKRIAIKPNLVAPVAASEGATTHPEIVAGLIEYLQSHGFHKIVMMEGSWVGDKTEEAFEVCGYRALSERYQVPFLDMQKEKGISVQAGDLKLVVCAAVKDVDFLINVPVLKGHCQTKMSCALKNMKGLLPNREKRRFHAMGLHKPIACLSKAVRQDFILVDHICGDLDFEDGGNPVIANQILAGLDPVLIDAYVCRLLGCRTGDVAYIEYAQELGVGSADVESADIRRWGVSEEVSLPRERKVVEISDRVEEVESCSACYAYLVPALWRLKEEGLLERLQNKICIGQGYRGETGELGVGSCTSGFRNSLPGCPPMEEDMYQFLREYLMNEGEEKLPK